MDSEIDPKITEMVAKAYPGYQVVEGRRLRFTWLRWSLWVKWAEIKHMLGWCTYIPCEVWDMDAGFIQFVGSTCYICGSDG